MQNFLEKHKYFIIRLSLKNIFQFLKLIYKFIQKTVTINKIKYKKYKSQNFPLTNTKFRNKPQ